MMVAGLGPKIILLQRSLLSRKRPNRSASSVFGNDVFAVAMEEALDQILRWTYRNNIHGIKDFVIPTKSFVKIGKTRIFCYNNKMFSSINKTFGCCSEIFGCNKKFFCSP